MPEPDRGRRTATAILVAVATAVAGFLPAAFLYDKATRLLRPVGSGEGALAQSLDVLFIGGPVCSLLLAATAGWLTYRSPSRHASRIALSFIVCCAMLSVVVYRYAR